MLSSNRVLLTAAAGQITGDFTRFLEITRESASFYLGHGYRVFLAVPPGWEARVSLAHADLVIGGNLKVVQLTGNAKGALATAILCLAILEADDEPVFVAAADTIMNGSKPHLAMKKISEGNAMMGVLAFPSQDNRFSYLAIDSNGKPSLVSEKERIGDFATTGTFFFRSTRQLFEAAEWAMVNNASLGGHFFVSAALNFAILKGWDLQVEVLNSECFTKTSFAIEQDI